MTRWMRLIAILAALAVMAAACGDDDDGGDAAVDAESGDESAAPAGDIPECAPGETDGDLFLYNWSEYIDPQLKDDFAAEFGVEVSEDFYDSNEAMQPIISAGNSGYDVIVPSDYMVSIMIQSGDLVPLNRDAIPNLANLEPDFASGPALRPRRRVLGPLPVGHHRSGCRSLGHRCRRTPELGPHLRRGVGRGVQHGRRHHDAERSP